MFRKVRYFILCILIFGVEIVYSQNFNALKKEADGEFLKGQFLEAKSKYRQLLAADQKSIDFNYKYGVCIYETENKLNARKYFDFILQQQGFPIKSNFYRGKIYQFEYEFDKAIALFERCKQDKTLNQLAANEINSCLAAKEQIKLKSSLVVKEKYLTQLGNHEKFYQLTQPYSFYSPDKGEIFDKQNSTSSFKPKYLFKRGMKYRVFASYSDKKENGLDIFIQIKNTDGDWAEIIRIPKVNTLNDDNYPFYDDSTQTLYFASKGHNSMGGYDIFKVNYDWKTNTVGDVVNIGFPYNSPSDDYLFVPDFNKNCAYFTTHRSGELLNAEVLYVSLKQHDDDIISAIGQWVDEVDQKQHTVKIYLRNTESNESFGPFVSDISGRIALYFPVNGTYEYMVEYSVYGEVRNFMKLVDIPKVGERERIEHTFRYFIENSIEQLEISTRVKYLDQFEELDPLKLQEISKLSINEKSLGNRNLIEEVSAVDVFSKLNIREPNKKMAVDKLLDSLLAKEIDMENNERFRIQANEKLKLNNEIIASLKVEIAERKEQIPSEEQNFDQQLNQKKNQLQELLEENLVLNDQIQRLNELNEIRPNLDDITLLNEELNEIIHTKSQEEVEIFVESKLSQIQKTFNIKVATPNSIVSELLKEAEEKLIKNQNELLVFEKQIDSLKRKISIIESEIKTLPKKKQEIKQAELSNIKKQLAIADELKGALSFENKLLSTETNAYRNNRDLIDYVSEESLKIKNIGLITELNNNFETKEKLIEQLIEVTQGGSVNSLTASLQLAKENYENNKLNLSLIKDPEEKIKQEKKLEDIFLKELNAISANENDEVKELIQLAENRINRLTESLDSISNQKQLSQANTIQETNKTLNTSEQNLASQQQNSTNETTTETNKGQETNETLNTSEQNLASQQGKNNLNGSKENENNKTSAFTSTQLSQIEAIVKSAELKSEPISASEQITLERMQRRATDTQQSEETSLMVSKALGDKSTSQINEDIAIVTNKISQLQNEIQQQKNSEIRRLLEQEKKFEEKRLSEFKTQLKQGTGSIELKLPSVNVNKDEIEVFSKTPAYSSYVNERIEYSRSVNTTNTIQQELGKLAHRLVTGSQLSIEEKSILKDSITWLQNQLLENKKNIATINERLLTFENQSKFEALVAQKIMPIETSSNPKTEELRNFDFVKKENMTYDVALPIGERKLSGLVFRVQVGAFRKTVPPNLFREFTPVNGELIGNGLTCYMAGFFNNSQSAINARNEIRSLGYSDAFIVAYCDGKRIPFEQGQAYELNKKCTSISENELTIKLQEIFMQDNQVANVGSKIMSSKSSVDEFGVEIAGVTDHLYFTVQVGVFNKSLNPIRLKGISELFIHKADNGQLRYSSGRFENLIDAKNRKSEVNKNGINDAFVVAYYKGKRISFAEAQQLIERSPEIVKYKNTDENLLTEKTVNGSMSALIANIDFSQLDTPVNSKKYYYTKSTKEMEVWNAWDASIPCGYDSFLEFSFTPIFESPFSTPSVLATLTKFQLKEFDQKYLGKIIFNLTSENSGEILNHMIRSAYMYEVKQNKMIVYALNQIEKEQLILVKEQFEEE